MQKSFENVLTPDYGETAKGGRFAAEIVDMLCRAFDAAKAEGVGRKMIARKIDETPRQLDVWCAKSRVQAITSEKLVRILCQDDALPDAARRQIMNDLATLAGFTVCADVRGDRKSPTAQITEMCAALGEVADEVRLSTNPKSEAGTRLSAGETRKAMAALDRLIGEATELKAAMVRGVRR